MLHKIPLMCILRVIFALFANDSSAFRGSRSIAPWTPLGAFCGPQTPAFQDSNKLSALLMAMKQQNKSQSFHGHDKNGEKCIS